MHSCACNNNDKEFLGWGRFLLVSKMMLKEIEVQVIMIRYWIKDSATEVLGSSVQAAASTYAIAICSFSADTIALKSDGIAAFNDFTLRQWQS